MQAELRIQELQNRWLEAEFLPSEDNLRSRRTAETPIGTRSSDVPRRWRDRTPTRRNADTPTRSFPGLGHVEFGCLKDRFFGEVHEHLRIFVTDLVDLTR